MRMGTSELIDILISFVVLTIAFSWRDLSASFNSGGIGAEIFIAYAVSVGAGFILHELAHKYTAIRFGYHAEYKASMMGLIMTIAFAVMTGWVFAAPGAVQIRKMSYSAPEYNYSYTDDKYWEQYDKGPGKEEGWIAVSGPLTNVILAGFFFAFILSGAPAYLSSLSGGLFSEGLILMAASLGIYINMFLAAFNMIPVDPFDGAKVFRASPIIWVVVAVPAILVTLGMITGLIRLI